MSDRLAANGGLYSRVSYADLFWRIGETYGAGDGVTTFQAPDARAEFFRGFDDGRGVDAGREFGSAQLGTRIADRVGLNATRGSVLNILEAPIVSVEAASSTGWAEKGVSGVVSSADNHVIFETRARNLTEYRCIKY